MAYNKRSDYPVTSVCYMPSILYTFICTLNFVLGRKTLSKTHVHTVRGSAFTVIGYDPFVVVGALWFARRLSGPIDRRSRVSSTPEKLHGNLQWLIPRASSWTRGIRIPPRDREGLPGLRLSRSSNVDPHHRRRVSERTLGCTLEETVSILGTVVRERWWTIPITRG